MLGNMIRFDMKFELVNYVLLIRDTWSKLCINEQPNIAYILRMVSVLICFSGKRQICVMVLICWYCFKLVLYDRERAFTVWGVGEK